MEGGTLFEQTRAAPEVTNRPLDWSCTGPVEYCGQAALQREIDCLEEALGDTPSGDAFLTSTAPASLEPGRDNLYYKSQEEFVFALAEAMSVEYQMIARSGLLLQVDDAWLAALSDRIINAQTYLFEAANVRHEHEYVVWERTRLPDDKILAPGVVSHATTLIEHPDLVSARIQRFANLVGRDRVIASTDCGLGLRCHPQDSVGQVEGSLPRCGVGEQNSLG